MKNVVTALLLAALPAFAEPALRTETFDGDPGWEGVNNRAAHIEPRKVVQDFGWSDGRIGGIVTPDGRPAYYAMAVPEATLDSPLSASGRIYLARGAGNTLLGFFNEATLNEWRTPNALVFRINGRGDTYHIHFEYATARWRAGAGVIGRYDKEADRMHPVELPADQWYDWTLTYDPAGADGAGLITATFGEHRAECAFRPEHRADGMTMNRFGLLNVNKSVDGHGELWLDRLAVLGEPVGLDADPGWEGLRNRETYVSAEVRPRFDFGYSASRFAGGAAPGEIGGLHFRGDCRFPERMACYGAVTETLTLDKPLHASGRIALTRGVTDSTVLFGFYHAERSMASSDSQAHALPESFFGVAVEGPSAEGFFLYPTWRTAGDASRGGGYDPRPPVILPDGASHTWTFDYVPPANGADGIVTVTLDGESVVWPVPAEALASGTVFNRLGFVTAWIDGNAQRVYIDDLTYTERQ